MPCWQLHTRCHKKSWVGQSKLNAIAVADFDGAIARVENHWRKFQWCAYFHQGHWWGDWHTASFRKSCAPRQYLYEALKSSEAVGDSGLNYLGTTTTPEFGLTLWKPQIWQRRTHGILPTQRGFVRRKCSYGRLGCSPYCTCQWWSRFYTNSGIMLWFSRLESFERPNKIKKCQDTFLQTSCMMVLLLDPFVTRGLSMPLWKSTSKRSATDRKVFNRKVQPFKNSRRYRDLHWRFVFGWFNWSNN